MRNPALAIASHRGISCHTGFLCNRNTIIKKLTITFSITESPMPNMTTVEAIWPCCMGGRYRINQVSRKQMLQMKATREKNNNFCIGRVGVKLHYFAHL